MTQEVIEYSAAIAAPGRLIIAGWTGRDLAAVEAHIAELEELGVTRPPSVPCYYRVSNARLTTATAMQVSGGDSSGEVEFVMVMSDQGLLIGVGSDHTDRQLETINVSQSKQICDKIIAPTLWRFEDVADHWDALLLSSWISDGEQKHLYQQGTVDHMLSVADLRAGLTDITGEDLQTGDVMFGGTLAAIGGIRTSPDFEIELYDPVLDRRLTHRYEITELPM